MNLAYLYGVRAADTYINDPPDGLAGVVHRLLPEASVNVNEAEVPEDRADAIGVGIGLDDIQEGTRTYGGGQGHNARLAVGAFGRDMIHVEGAAAILRERLPAELLADPIASGDGGTFTITRCDYEGTNSGAADEPDVVGTLIAYYLEWQWTAA